MYADQTSFVALVIHLFQWKILKVTLSWIMYCGFAFHVYHPISPTVCNRCNDVFSILQLLNTTKSYKMSFMIIRHLFKILPVYDMVRLRGLYSHRGSSAPIVMASTLVMGGADLECIRAVGHPTVLPPGAEWLGWQGALLSTHYVDGSVSILSSTFTFGTSPCSCLVKQDPCWNTGWLSF